MNSAKYIRGTLRRPSVVLLLVLILVGGANQWHLYGLEQELDELAAQKISALRPPSGESSPGAGRIASEVVVSKPYAVWGQPNGKISVYVEHTSPGESPVVMGFDYFFTRESDTTWTETESGACDSEQCEVDGKRALRSATVGW